MNRTNIEWIVNPDGSHPGWSWNPLTGCLNNCSYCFARKLANGRLKSRYLANDCVATKLKLSPPAESLKSALDVRKALEDPFYPRFWGERLEQVTWFRKHPTNKGIFVCDMGELFGGWVPKKWQEAIFDVIYAQPWHRFYLLTKQPQNLIKFSPFPENCWVGVSCDSLQQFAKSWGILANIKATIKFISFEPLLERVEANLYESLRLSGVKWVIIGAQTKPYKPPRIEWVEDIVEACDKAGVKVFLKDNLKQLLPAHAPFVTNPLRDNEFYLRQEVPND